MPDTRHLLGFGFVILLTLGAAATAAEATLNYSVSYRGVFSMGQDMSIADVALSERTLPGNPDIVETRLEASSAAHPTVESLYPMRYRFRLWSDGKTRQLLGLESFQKTRKTRHRIYLPDGSESGMRRLDAAKSKGREVISRLERGDASMARRSAGLLLDRLGMLQQIRRQRLNKGASYRFDVTNGRDRFAYRATVEAAKTLKIAGRRLKSWKIRIDGVELGKDGVEEIAHRPAYVWLDQRAGHVPLRIDTRHPIGRFRVELKRAPTAVALAGAG